MIHIIGKTPEKLNDYRTPQKVVFLVLTAGPKVFIATSLYVLRAAVAGQSQGIRLDSTSGNVALDFGGEIFWASDTEGTQVEVLEGGAL